jgi:type I restriction-modification system DNA methylase subunit
MDFQTPDWVCEIMMDIIPFKPRIVLEPTAGIGNIVAAISRRFPECEIEQPKDIFSFTPNCKFDMIVANPPFSPMSLGFEILQLIWKWADYMLIILPWLLLINSEERANWFFNNGLSRIVHLPRKAFEGSRVQTAIFVFERNFAGNTTIGLIPESEQVDVSKYF